mgnify:CR=1 FL=1
MPRPTSQQSPRTNANKPAPWPYKAAGVLDDTLVRLSTIDGWARKVDKAHADIDELAQIGLTAAQTGNHELVRQAFSDIRSATANTRHYCVDIRNKAGEAKAALAGARDGRYEG